MIAQSPQLTAVQKKTKRPGFRVKTIYAVLFVVCASSRAARSETPEQPAWNILRAGMAEKNTGKRTQAVRALRLLPGNPEATEMARMALKDPKTDVRVAAANALGLMNSKESVAELKKVLSDRNPGVVLAAAHSLLILNDPSSYEAYYELLTGERKSAEGLIAREMSTLNTKKVVEFGIEEGLGFLPFADEGYSAVKAIRKDGTSTVRALAARDLVKDADPRVSEALVRVATSDKSWLVRASALLAIAKREDPDLLTAVVPTLSDKNRVVRFTAAAAVIRLSTVAAHNKDPKHTSNLLGCKSIDPVGPPRP